MVRWLKKFINDTKEFQTYDEIPEKIDQSLITKLKKIGKQVIQLLPKDPTGVPFLLRIDFGCCQGNTLDTSKYFLNEIEYAGCGLFTELKNVLHHWRDGYYQKAMELFKQKK